MGKINTNTDWGEKAIPPWIHAILSEPDIIISKKAISIK